MTKDHAGLTHEHAALQARFKTMLNGPFINLHIRRDIEMAEKVLESIPAMLEQARAEGREEAARVVERVSTVFGEKPPSGERGTNIVWDTAQRCAAAIRSIEGSTEADVRRRLAADPNYPLGEPDAMKWAIAFRVIAECNGWQLPPEVDDGLMVGWFANAMATQEMQTP